MAECHNIRRENNRFPLALPKLSHLLGQKQSRGPRFLIIYDQTLSIFVKHITLIHTLVRNAGNLGLKLIIFTRFQILLILPKLSPLTNVNALRTE